MEKKKMRSNIWKLYLIRALNNFLLTIPVIVLFFQENGLTMSQVLLLQSLFSVSAILMEVPTGYFSDIFGRKRSIIIGGFVSTLGFAIYSQSYGFWGFLAAEIILGIGMSFTSGADDAMLCDTLLEGGEGFKYMKMKGKSNSFGMLSSGLASVLGGFLAVVSLRYPLYWDVVITFLIVPVAFTLFEPKRHLEKKNESNLSSIMRLVKFSLYDHGEIKWLIIYSSLASASTLVMFWFIQPYLLATRVPLPFFGIILTSLLAVAAFFSWKAHWVEKVLGRKKSLMLLVVMPAIGYLLVSSFWFVWSAAFIAIFYIARGINDPISSDYVNDLVSSDFRATILSVKNMIGRIIFAIVGPIAGWMSDTFSLKTALLSSGATFLVLGLLALFSLRKHEKA